MISDMSDQEKLKISKQHKDAMKKHQDKLILSPLKGMRFLNK